jgi:hypothetical protein
MSFATRGGLIYEPPDQRPMMLTPTITEITRLSPHRGVALLGAPAPSATPAVSRALAAGRR